jgi:hypothetical protein
MLHRVLVVAEAFRSRQSIRRAAALMLLAILIVTAKATASDASVEEVPSTDPLARELAPVVEKWRLAVSRQDEKGLLDFALPEDRDRVERDLTSETSLLTRVLFKDPDSLSHFLEHDVSWKAARHTNLRNEGRGTTVCFFDVKRASKDVSAVSLMNLRDPKTARCFFLFFTDSRWFVSFGFAYPD